MPSNGSTQPGPRIMVVDDSRVIRVAARRILAPHYEVLEAGDGEEAWELLGRETGVRLLISDLSMPRLSGLGLLQRLRQAGAAALRDLPVIIVTGAEDDDEATKQSALAAGASDFISKPFDPVRLLARVQAHIRYVSTADSLREQQAAMADQATLDPVTGLGNHRLLMERGHQQVAYATRHRTDLSLLRLELDGVVTLRGRHGDSLADAALRQVAGVLRRRMRREDTAARIGPAGFALLLPATNPVGVRRLGARICEDLTALRLTVAGEAVELQPRTAVLSPVIRRDTRFDELLAEADAALGMAPVPDAPQRAAPALADMAVEPEPAPPATAPPTAPSGTVPTTAADTAVPDLDTALAAIAAGRTGELLPHLETLGGRVLPLLELWNRERCLDLDSVLARLRARTGR